MEGVARLLEEAWAAGLQIHAEADDLVIRGPQRYEQLARLLLDRKAAVLSALEEGEAEVAWRSVVMRQQVKTQGSLPFLMARELNGQIDGCQSCGDALLPGRTVRCAACAEAAKRIVFVELHV